MRDWIAEAAVNDGSMKDMWQYRIVPVFIDADLFLEALGF